MWGVRERERERLSLAVENVVLCCNGGSFVVMEVGGQQMVILTVTEDAGGDKGRSHTVGL